MEPLYIQMILGLFSAVASGLVSFVWWKIKKLDEKREEIAKKQQEEHEKAENMLKQEIAALKEGTLSILRDRLISVIEECEGEGEKKVFQVENVNHMMNAYVGLGGNGTIKHLYEKFKLLPMKGGEPK